jgi:hypothetical protein
MIRKLLFLTLLVGLVTTYAAAQSPADPFTSIPSLKIPPYNPDDWMLTKSDTFTPGVDWSVYGDIEESTVFHTRLIHQEDEHNSWEMRIGKGSQVYSLITSRGELVGAQNTYEGGQWIDRVIQTVAVDLSLNQASDVPYGIHQAGTYVSDDLSEPFFSPLLYEEWNPQNHTYQTLVWGQQAWLPSAFQSGILVEQTIQDLGNGVIHFTYVLHNFGSDTITFLNLPWSGWRKQIYPNQIISQPDGTMEQTQFVWVSYATTPDYQTDGWMALTEGTEPDDFGLGFVFGTEKYRDLDFQRQAPDIQIGTLPEEDLIVVTNRHFPTLYSGESYFATFFLIVNTFENIQQLGAELADEVEYGFVVFDQESAGLLPVCLAAQDFLTRYCGSEDTPMFYTYAYPPAGAMPLFLLQNTQTADYLVTPDPYAFSPKPYDSMTRYVAFLGWAVGEASLNTKCYAYLGLQGILGKNYSENPLHQNAYVRANADQRC